MSCLILHEHLCYDFTLQKHRPHASEYQCSDAERNERSSLAELDGKYVRYGEVLQLEMTGNGNACSYNSETEDSFF